MKIASINFEKSIKLKRLVFKKNFEYYFDLYFQLFVNLGLIFGLGINILSWKDYGTNEKSFLIVFIIFTIYFNYLLFNKFTERNLICIKTENQKDKNIIIVLEYIKQNDIKIQRNSNNIIIAIDDLGSTGLFTWKKNHIAFLFHENQILFTLLTERNKVNFPSLIDRISLKKDIITLTKLGSS